MPRLLPAPGALHLSLERLNASYSSQLFYVPGRTRVSSRESTTIELNDRRRGRADDAGAALTYTFARWYQLAGGYRYYNRESDLSTDVGGNYDEHRLFVQLSFAHELFRW